MKRSKKTPVQKMVAVLDGIARERVKSRVGYVCERCGRVDAVMNWAHILGRGKREVRWGCRMKDGSYCWNAFSLCVGCHYWFDNSTNRGEAYDWLETKLGRATWMELKERARVMKIWGIKELREKLEELENLNLTLIK